MISKASLIQLIRYGVIGLLHNSCGYIFYLLATFLGAPPMLVVGLMYPLATILSFIGNKQWTFDFQGGAGSSFMRFVIVQVMGYFMNLLLLFYFVEQLNYPHQLVQAVAIFVVAAFLFVALKFFVFSSISDD